MNKIKKLFQTSESKHGSYSVGVTAIVIAIIVVINLIVGQLPENIRNIDISSNNLYDISTVTTDLLDTLEHKITLTVLANKEDTDDRIKTFISKYAALSKDISVTWIDPVLHPSALTEYETDANTIVVGCADTDKTTTVAFSDILVVDESMAYYYGSSDPTEFDGEGQLTSAVNYVTSDVTKTIYRTTGHGESTFSTTISDMMEKSNYTVTELDLFQEGVIPEDCDLLLFDAPTNDLTKDEKTVVTDYLAAGGKVMVILGDTESSALPNLSALLKDYGFEQAEGYIADTSSNYQGNYYYIIPTLSVSGNLANGISSQTTLVVNARGFNQADPVRDTITMVPFMTTSDKGYAVTDENNAAEGTYVLGGVATEEVDDGTAQLTAISAASLIDSQITDAFSSLENVTLFMNAVSNNFDGVTNLSIEAKTLTTETNTMQHGGVISLFLIFGIPVLVIVGGFVVWFKRRKA
ncbi:MAG: GldG family protein [Hespellia sp.]|nr:GldG family protein [Hespellia sp.]